MRKFLLFLSLFFAMAMTTLAQEPVVSLTSEDLGTNVPYMLSEEDAAKVFELDVVTVVAKVTTGTLSGRGTIMCVADPSKAVNTEAIYSNSYYVAVGSNNQAIGYLASAMSGQHFTEGNKGQIPNNTEDVILGYVIDGPANNFKSYLGDLQMQNRNFGSWVVTTPKMVHSAWADANIYIGAGMTSAGVHEAFDGTVTAVKFYSGELTAEQIANAFAEPALEPLTVEASLPAGSTMISDITLTFSDAVAGTYDEAAESFIYVGSEENKCSYTVAGNVVTLSLVNPITEAGDYTIYIPEGLLTREADGSAVSSTDGSLQVSLVLPISVVTHEIMEGVLTVQFSGEIAGTYDEAAEQVAIVGNDGEPVYCMFEVMGNLLMVLLPEGMADGEYVLAVLDGITSAADGSAVVLHPAYGTGYSFTVGGVPEALTVTVTSPTEAVDSLKTITLTFNKPIFDSYDEESEAYIYVDSEDNKCSYAAIDEVVTLTLLNPITTPGEHVIYIPTGVLTALGGDVVEVMDSSLVVTVAEPAASVIYPADGMALNGTAAFVAEGASFDGDCVVVPTGEIVGLTFTSENVDLTHTQVSTSNSQVASSLVRWYKNDILTFTPKNGYKLTKIVFDGLTSSSHRGTPTANVGEVTAYDATTGVITWTGESAEAVELTASASQVRFASVVVYYELDATGDAVAAPIFSTPTGVTVGLLYNPTTVLLTAAEGATIYYVTDDSELSSNSNVYTQPIELGYGVTTIKAFAVLDGVASAAFEAVYNVMVAAPKFSLAAGAYAQGTELEILSETTDATIAVLSGYQLSNDIKALSSYYYKAGVTTKSLNSTSEFKAIARVITAEGDTLWSDIVTAKYYASEVLPYKAATAVESGANYVLNYNNTVITPIAENLNYGNLVAVEGALENGYVKTLAHYAFTITAVEGAEDTYTIQDVYGRYLYDTDDTYSTFNVAAEKPEAGAEWVITFTGGGKATIKNTLTELYLSYYASKKHFNLYSNAAEVTLCAQSEYPTFTTVPTGEYDETLTSISTVTIACERGLALADGAAAVTLVANGDYDNVYTGTATLADDGNSISVSFGQEFTANGDYVVTIPAGMFYMEPDGLNVANEETVLDLNIYVATPLEVVSITPAAGEVESLSVIKIEFNQDVNNGTDMPVVTDANGSEYTFMQLYYDEENNAEIPANEVWFVAIDSNYEPVTIDAAGTYTLDLSTFTVYPVGVWTPLTFAGTTSYSWTIAEAVEPATQYYRIYSTSQSKYLHIESYNASNTSGPKGAVGLSDYVDAEANPEQSANQIFKLEDAGDGLVYLVSANEYYIVCRQWNVDACNDGQKSALGMDYISDTEFRLMNGSQYFKVGEVDGEWGAYYPYCDAAIGLAETWRLEPATVPTGIENVITEGAVVEGIYDITGRKIEAITAPGIYIVNGKKVLVK